MCNLQSFSKVINFDICIGEFSEKMAFLYHSSKCLFTNLSESASS